MTDPKQVYVLRWIAGRHAGVPEFAPPYTSLSSAATAATGTLYWKNIGGEVLDETDLAGNTQEEYIYFGGQRIARRTVDSGGNTVALHYYFSDHLGSHGVVENTNGTACEQDIDYYPYGSVQNDYCATQLSQRYKFTGKERDSESGLDNFGARYDASSLGRFMSPDPDQESGIDNMGNPQVWNGYAYVGNNPLNATDPDGRSHGKPVDRIVVVLTFDKSGNGHLVSANRRSDVFARHGPDGRIRWPGQVSLVLVWSMRRPQADVSEKPKSPHPDVAIPCCSDLRMSRLSAVETIGLSPRSRLMARKTSSG
jgi:RHS repeat-associated protein